jgi:phosphoglycerate dehydrogenase-like enzyme
LTDLEDTVPILLLAIPQRLLTESDLAAVQANAGDLTVLATVDEAEIEAQLSEIEVACFRFPRRLLARAPRLRWFQQWGAGADWLLREPEIQAHPFVLTNASGVHPVQISEHILATMLAMARKLPTAVRAQLQGAWTLDDRQLNENTQVRHEVFELAGKTALLVGVGAIGARTARLCAALEMVVWGVRRNPNRPVNHVTRLVGPDRLHDLLPQADFVILTAPLTPETRHLIDAAALARMKPDSFLVNIGRGALVDEPALIAALQAGTIAGAALDVFETEPLPAASPLWQMDNVLITPHESGASPHYHERAMGIFLDNLQRYTAGEPLRNVVDKQLAY